MAKEAGLVMNRPALTPSTRLALEATEYAKLKGVGEEFHMAAYAAYWGEGVDLGKMENLKPIGESVGLDWSDLSHHLDERTHKESVENQYKEALGVGVTGIPAYVLGKFFFTGAQPYDLFKQVAERALVSAQQDEDAEGESSES